jgi:hypothetical protein
MSWEGEQRSAEELDAVPGVCLEICFAFVSTS